MPWFKVDDQLAFNAKAVAAGNSAMGLWVRAGSWSSAQLTDGFIPTHMANAMANAMANPCDWDALVMAGLWQEVEGGFQFHDWSDFQPDAESEKKKRKARSEAGKRGAEARWNGKTAESHGKSHSKSHGKTMANDMANECDRNAPSRPDPSRPSVGGSRRKPEVPMPSDWQPKEAHTGYAQTHGINLQYQEERFRNWAASKDARYRDWDAAFRNWLMKAEKDTSASSPSPWDRKGVHS